MTFWISDWLRAFVLTLGLELLIAIPGLRVGPSILRRIQAVSIVNLATHPIVWFVCPALAQPIWVRFAVAELFAVVVEAWIYAVILLEVSSLRAFTVSLSANAVSAATGLLIDAVKH